MKKVFAILLATALVATLSVVAFAETQTINLPFTSEQPINITVTPFDDLEVVYGVDIIWDSDMEFEYHAGDLGVWDPVTHTRTETVEAGWKDQECTIYVANHSAAGIQIDVTVNDANTEDDVVFALDRASETLSHVVGQAPENVHKAPFVISVDGTPTEDMPSAATVTVAISAYHEGDIPEGFWDN